MKKEELTKILKDKNINPTYQRIIILDFLISDYNHSSCNEIYNKLSKKYPIINRATVYNTLNLFYDMGLVNKLCLDDKCHYEYKKKDHGHFICKKCAKIYDFDVETSYMGLDNFDIETKEVKFYGFCNMCLSEEKEKK